MKFTREQAELISDLSAEMFLTDPIPAEMLTVPEWNTAAECKVLAFIAQHITESYYCVGLSDIFSTIEAAADYMRANR